MLSINQRKRIHLLSQKKYRDKSGLFLVEGEKMVFDLLETGEINKDNTDIICASQDFYLKIRNTALLPEEKIIESTEAELKKISNLVTAPKVIAIIKKSRAEFSPELLKADYTLALESIRDPGNLGTIIRTADWFGIKNIFCSPDSVDFYNQKVIQASMGAVFRVNVHYMELADLFEVSSRFKIPVYGTTMDGENLHDTPVKYPSMLAFGNESRGISEALQSAFKNKIRIPDYPLNKAGSESLNLAMSVAILCSELRRRQQ